MSEVVRPGKFDDCASRPHAPTSLAPKGPGAASLLIVACDTHRCGRYQPAQCPQRVAGGPPDVRLGGLLKRTPLAFARGYTKPLVRAPSGYSTAALAPSKGRLMRCTVDGLTPNRSAMTRIARPPGN